MTERFLRFARNDRERRKDIVISTKVREDRVEKSIYNTKYPEKNC